MNKKSEEISNPLKGIGLKLTLLAEKMNYSETGWHGKAGVTYTGIESIRRKESCTTKTLHKLSDFFKVPIFFWFDREYLIRQIKEYANADLINDFQVQIDEPPHSPEFDVLEAKYNAALEKIENLQKVIQTKEEMIELLKNR